MTGRGFREFHEKLKVGEVSAPQEQERAVPTETLYDADFFAWTEQQAEALRRAARDRANVPLDWENIAEEIESLGRSDRHAAESQIENIIAHLLKLGCSPALRPRLKWKHETDVFRRQLARTLRESPSLRSKVPDMIAEIWPAGLRALESELRMRGELKAASPHIARFRLKGEFSPDEVLCEGAFPSRGSSRFEKTAN